MYNGVINVYKEPGFTSHDVVAKLRGITHQKKIGHTGTLDPDAVGVLCVCLGAATHICDMLTDERKEYEAVMLLGVKTDTLDTSGTVLSTSEVNVSEERIREVCKHYVGDISQIPPMYSALKINGKKLYELARSGIEVERKPRTVTVYDIRIMNISVPRITLRVSCSKGTYIRSLIDDIGNELGCGAAMEHLIRTEVGRFKVEDALTLDKISEYTKMDRLSEILISPYDMFDDLVTVTVNERGEKLASNGNVISLKDIRERISLHNEEKVRVINEDNFFFGVYKYREDGDILKPERMFLC